MHCNKECVRFFSRQCHLGEDVSLAIQILHIQIKDKLFPKYYIRDSNFDANDGESVIANDSE